MSRHRTDQNRRQQADPPTAICCAGEPRIEPQHDHRDHGVLLREQGEPDRSQRGDAPPDTRPTRIGTPVLPEGQDREQQTDRSQQLRAPHDVGNGLHVYGVHGE